MNRKTILVYGDSNTWGKNDQYGRLPYGERWVTILQSHLGDHYDVVSEGLSGRTAGSFLQEGEQFLDGQHHFEVAFRSAAPVDLLIIALGTNDLKYRFHRPEETILSDILWYGDMARDLSNASLHRPQLLYIIPPNINNVRGPEQAFDDGKRQFIAEQLPHRAEYTVHINDIALSSDGVHFAPEGHRQMAGAVYKKIQEMGV